MGRPAPLAWLTYDEHLAGEAASEVRHEYLDGDVWALAGGTPRHAALSARVGPARWEVVEARAGESVEIASLGIRLDVGTVYADPLAAGA